MFQINQLYHHRGRANVNGQTVEVTAVIVEDFSIIADSIPISSTTGSLDGLFSSGYQILGFLRRGAK
jgi:hypothetical protein